MFNWGVDATKQMFPKSTATQLINATGNTIKSSYTAPLFLVGLAADKFKEFHKEAINSQNKLLKEKYDTLYHNFVSQLQAEVRTFTNKPLCRKIVDTVLDCVKHIDYKDNGQKNAHLREFIIHANLIVTNSKEIQECTTRGLQNSCALVRDIWLASYHMPWYTSKIRIEYANDPNLKHMSGTGRIYVPRQVVRRKEDQDWLIKNSWRMRTNLIRYGIFDKRNDLLQIDYVNGGNPVHLASPDFKINDADIKKGLEMAARQL